jgi:cell division protease FtsH
MADPKRTPPRKPGTENKDPNQPPGNWFARSWFWIVLIVMLIVFSRFIFAGPSDSDTLTGLNEVARQVQAGNVDEIVVQGESVIVDTLRAFGVTSEQLETLPVTVENMPNSGAVLSWLMMLLPMLLIFGFFIFIMRQAGGGGQNRAMQFGRSRARKMDGADRPTVTFNDVAGSDEAKQELQEVVEFLKEPQKFAALGARIPKGVLMVGSPGTGKTLLAKAVAGEAGVPFFSASGSEFVEMFVGVGASRVRDLFEQAKKNSPCIIFVDEIDAVGRHRGAGMGGGNDEREQTLNQILVEMDGFDTDTNIVVIAATNRPDILDPALLRPGRFDRKVVVDRPDRRGREAILKVHSRGKPLAADIDLAVIASQTAGMVGADLENLVNEAAILAARRNKRAISMSEMVESIERIIAGPARRSRVLDADDRRIVAYHEAGHALVMEELEFTDHVGKITIISRGQALGYVMPLPDEDKTLLSRAQYEDSIAGLLAGRIAEELIFNQPSTVSSNDLERVTKTAKAMVTRFGMSDVIGPMQLQHGDVNPFMGMELGQQRGYSEDIARKIDQEVRRIVESAYVRSREILVRRKDQLVLVAETLLEKEVIDRQEFIKLIGGDVTRSAPAAAD